MSSSPPPGFDRPWLDARLAELERDWHAGRLRQAADALPLAGPAARRAMLLELVRHDLWHSWKHGARRPVPSYLADYPELGPPGDDVVALFRAEQEVRRQFPPGPDAADRPTALDPPAPPGAAPLSSLLWAESITPPPVVVPATGAAAVILAATADIPVLPEAMAKRTHPPSEAVTPPPPGAGDRPTLAVPIVQGLPESFGKFRILRQVGEGGMGSVYEALDTQLERRVALKVPFTQAPCNASTVARFRQEARAAARLRHPHLCPVYEDGELDGIPFLVMAFIEGRPLSRLIPDGKPLPPGQAVALMILLAEAMEEAHRQGVIHRDLKPSNILIDPRGEPVIVDFGLARQMQEERRLTVPGQLLGTPLYMAPEQMGGTFAVDHRCDVYSLGVIFYELLTGVPPYRGTLTEVVVQVLSGEHLAPSRHRPDLDLYLEKVCLKAMARAPDDRYVRMADFAQALRDYRPDRQVGRVPMHDRPTAPIVVPAPSAPGLHETAVPFLPLASDAWRQPAPPLPQSRSKRWLLLALGAPALGVGAVVVISLALHYWPKTSNGTSTAVASLPATTAGLEPTRTATGTKPAVRPTLDDARAALAAGDYPRAAETLSGILKVDSRNAEAHYLFGLAHAGLGDPDRALADRETAVGLDPALAGRREPKYAALYADRGRKRLADGDYAPAAADFTTALENAPDAEGAALGRAQAHLGQARLSQRRPDYRRAKADADDILRGEKSAGAYLCRGAACNGLRDHDKAVKDFSEAETRGAGSPARLGRAEALAWRGYTRADCGDCARAVADCEAVLREVAAGSAEEAAALTWRAFARATAGDPDAALADADRAVTSLGAAEPPPARRPLLVAALLARAEAFAGLGQFERTRADCAGALRLAPLSAMAHLIRGNAFRRQHEYALAESDFSRALELDSEYALALTDRAAVRAEQKRDAEARADYAEAIRLAGAAPAWAYLERAGFYLDRADSGKALADCDAAIQREPDYAMAYVYRSQVHSADKNYPAAIADCREALQRNPNSAVAFHELAVALTRKKDYAAAVDAYSREIFLGRPRADLARAFDDRGFAHSKQKNHAEAVTDFTRAIVLNPKNGKYFKHRAVSRAELGDKDGADADRKEADRLNGGGN